MTLKNRRIMLMSLREIESLLFDDDNISWD